MFDWRAVDERAIGSKVKDRNEETEARSYQVGISKLWSLGPNLYHHLPL